MVCLSHAHLAQVGVLPQQALQHLVVHVLSTASPGIHSQSGLMQVKAVAVKACRCVAAILAIATATQFRLGEQRQIATLVVVAAIHNRLPMPVQCSW